MNTNIWFTSDTHFGHANIIKYCNRPFLSEAESVIYSISHTPNATDDQKAQWSNLKLSRETLMRHDDQLVTNWNRMIDEDDMVYHLGDFCFGNKKYVVNLVDKLNGRICLVKGNHDKSIMAAKDSLEWVKDYYELVIKDESLDYRKRLIVLFHYAMRVWDASHYGSWHLFGHSHGNLPAVKDQLTSDIGVDFVANNIGKGMPEDYRPISYDEVTDLMQTKEWVSPIVR